MSRGALYPLLSNRIYLEGIAGAGSIDENATSQGHAREYFRVLLRLSYLAPDIIAAVLDGDQPASLTRQKLVRMSALPLEWRAQSRMLACKNPFDRSEQGANAA